MKSVKIDLFCQTLENFMGELVTMYPEDQTLSWCLTMYKNFGGLYKDQAVSQVIDAIKPYTEQILQRNESFFLDQEYHEFKNDQFISTEIEKIKKIWIDPSTTDQTKEAIWKYMITFVKIGKSLKMC